MGILQNHLNEAVLKGTHNLCFARKWEKVLFFSSENCRFYGHRNCNIFHRDVYVILTRDIDEISLYLTYTCTLQ